MRLVKSIYLLILLFSTFTSSSQVKRQVSKDTAITFKVYGVCVQCKERIEKAVKGKGVRYAVWNEVSKQLSLIYYPTLTTLDKIENRIVNAGHDLENKKAKNSVYNDLPTCCHYRDISFVNSTDKQLNLKINNSDIADISKDSNVHTGAGELQDSSKYIKGVVLETGSRGDFVPLQGATIYWLGTNSGTTTDSSGFFSVKVQTGSKRLVVSYTGFTQDTLLVINQEELKIILATDKKLTEVIVSSHQRSRYLLTLNPIRTEIITEKELFKAACCNLSESFETNPSVDVSYNDAVTGSKQIQLLGLSGNYTQLTIENLPGPRGLGTPLGLNSIAGPWVESIQLTKGIGSVLNGFESIAGQINVELKKPENSESLYANLYINDFGKTDLNLDLAKKISRKWSTGLLLHDDLLANKNLDFNRDGFRDLPTGNQFNLVNRWKYDDGKGVIIQLGIKALHDTRTGGETAYNASNDKNTTHHYGLGINTDRDEAFAKVGYVFPGKKYKSIGLQLSAFDHSQHDYFGLTTYDASQKNVYGNLIYQSIINNTNHKFKAGISFQYDKYQEDFNMNKYNRTEVVPGAFFEYTYSHTDKFNVVAGFRTDRNSLFGFFMTPRLHIRYEPVKGTTIRLSAGRGQRTANIFAENSSVFVSSRQLNIVSPQPGKAYGLDPEVAWNKGISIDQKFKAFSKDGLLSLDYFRNDFSNQVVVDLEDPRQVKFYNLQGLSYSNSFQVELNLETLKDLNIRLAYRYFDVKTTYSGKLLQRPLTAANRAFSNLAYAVNRWKFDYTISYNGTKRIPGTSINPPPYQLVDHSPAFVLMNAQVSKTIGRKLPMDLYIGAENLANYFQKKAIIAADQPFGPYFDASLVYAPVFGRMFYVGWRLKIK